MSRPPRNNHFDYDESSSHGARAPAGASVTLSDLDGVVIVDPDEGVYDYTAHSCLLSFEEGISPPANTPTFRRSFTLDDPVVFAELSRISRSGPEETRQLTHGDLAQILRAAPCARAISRGEAYHCSSASLRLASCPGSEHSRTQHCALYTARPYAEFYGDAGGGWRLQSCSRPDLHGLPPDELSRALAAHESPSSPSSRNRLGGRTRTRRQ